MSTSSPTRVNRRTWWIVGVLGVAAMSGLAIWFGIAGTAGKVHWVNTGFSIVSDQQIDVRFDVIRDPERPVVCDLHALDAQHARVGTAQVRIEPEERSPARHIEPLRTVARATTGYVDTCSYAD